MPQTEWFEDFQGIQGLVEPLAFVSALLAVLAIGQTLRNCSIGRLVPFRSSFCNGREEKFHSARKRDPLYCLWPIFRKQVFLLSPFKFTGPEMIYLAKLSKLFYKAVVVQVAIQKALRHGF